MSLIYRYILLFFLICIAFTACTDDDLGTAKIEIKTSGDIELASNRNASATITISCSSRWQAMSTASWLSLSSKSGESGTSRLKVVARSANNTFAERKALVVIGSGLERDTIKVVQHPAEYVKADDSYFYVDAEGTTLNVSYSSNIETGIYLTNPASWIRVSNNKLTKSGNLSIEIAKNPSKRPRTAYLYFTKKINDISMPLLIITIVQNGIGAISLEYTSTDYSADGMVRVIQHSTRGKGIPVVIMGDGYVDKDIASGKFDEAANIAAEHFFSEEPIKSLREYFDVYAVTAVSANTSFSTRSRTAFSCKFESASNTNISGDENAVIKYVKKIDDVSYQEATVIVILNSINYAGTTILGYTDNVGNLIDFAISYCPTIDSLQSESFRQVLCHEAVGHGFAKLNDEYYYDSYGAMPEDEIENLQMLQSNDWCLNVDIEKNKSKVRWSKFITDTNFDSENIGVYEGACTYSKGVYRPSQNSMMRNNNQPFNAPSRQLIYNRVMTRSGGFKPNYDEFVEFDKRHYPQFNNLKSAQEPTRHFAHPDYSIKRLK